MRVLPVLLTAAVCASKRRAIHIHAISFASNTCNSRSTYILNKACLGCVTISIARHAIGKFMSFFFLLEKSIKS